MLYYFEKYRIMESVLRLGFYILSLCISLSSWSSHYVNLHFSSSFEGEVYDYIVVGGGASGSVVAGRLAEYGATVLLLEAGGYPPWWSSFGTIDIPIMGPAWQRTELDWSYETEPQTHACYGMTNKKSRWPMGRMLGGSARLNNLVYLRGNWKDWKDWGLSHKDMLKYFLRSENHMGVYVNDSHFHSTGGWLPVSDMPLRTKLSDAVLNGACELGSVHTDLNSMDQTGFMFSQLTSLHGSRFSADKTFLYNESRQNLHVVTEALVNQVLFRNQTKATGVHFHHKNQWHSVRSQLGIILSAGAVGSPKILLQSGIGPPAHLQEMGIDCRVPLKFVGQNLQDHVSTGTDLVLINTTLSISLSSLTHPASFLEYILEGRGPWTHGGCEVVGLLHTALSNGTFQPPDVQIMVLPAGVAQDKGSHIRHNLGLSDQIWDGYFSPLVNAEGLTSVSILVVLLHPRSRGEVRLRSSDPFEKPVIDPNYLSHSEDVDTLVEGIYWVKELLKTKPMLELGAHLNPKTIPGCEEHVFDSHAYWQCYVRTLTLTTYHPAGTCRMGHKSDPTAVVDHSFRVHDTENLYVVDASVIPNLPSANIVAIVTALAEKAAGSILNRSQDCKQDTFSAKIHKYISRRTMCNV